jgi:hypothetical protein
LEFLKHKDGTINISDFEKLLKSWLGSWHEKGRFS